MQYHYKQPATTIARFHTLEIIEGLLIFKPTIISKKEAFRVALREMSVGRGCCNNSADAAGKVGQL